MKGVTIMALEEKLNQAKGALDGLKNSVDNDKE